MNEKERAKIIEKMLLSMENLSKATWSSLTSHLQWAYMNKDKDDRKFEKDCVKEYTEMLEEIVKVMKEIIKFY